MTFRDKSMDYVYQFSDLVVFSTWLVIEVTYHGIDYILKLLSKPFIEINSYWDQWNHKKAMKNYDME